MVRDRAGGLVRKSGINPLPIIIFVVVALAAGGGLYAWDYSWRQQQEAARRPPSPDVLARNLVENIIGKDTVKDVQVDTAAGTVAITFESATFKPEDAAGDPGFAKKAREYLTAEAKLASGAILLVGPQLGAQQPVLQNVRNVTLTIVYKGATLATAVAEPGKDPQITFVDSRLQ